ncbi:hypothetical protein FHR81_003457 [Actinoalloteichus hoggarensis]|uniref:Uncharacterized protein n=1 Tax=Actinoalloteichus hoggarensis TaxID=1470176 RepID=A0A221W7C5_9PSEU|nr:hypothetical protein [Actinoalloteichus hoggarensis]ASO21808.1 hypothetical protein AHOG_20955 [Actinoalloteichus hoggarensis]MBB5922405.1 hypothetical protein [Actinoalloteichus hoggarensis]
MEWWGLDPAAVVDRLGTTVTRTASLAVGSAVAVVALPGRVFRLVEAVEALVVRIDAVVESADDLLARTRLVVAEAEALVGRADDIVTAASGTVGDAGRVAGTAGAVVTEAARTSRAAAEVLALYQPLAQRLAPMATRFVDGLSPQEVTAAIRLVDKLPVLTEHLLEDILPILSTLDRVGPDIHDLLGVADEVRKAVLGIPGFAFFRRRGDEKTADDESESAESAGSTSAG